MATMSVRLARRKEGCLSHTESPCVGIKRYVDAVHEVGRVRDSRKGAAGIDRLKPLIQVRVAREGEEAPLELGRDVQAVWFSFYTLHLDDVL